MGGQTAGGASGRLAIMGNRPGPAAAFRGYPFGRLTSWVGGCGFRSFIFLQRRPRHTCSKESAGETAGPPGAMRAQNPGVGKGSQPGEIRAGDLAGKGRSGPTRFNKA